MAKQATAFRLSDEAQRLLARLAERFSVSKTAIMEIAIREKAQKEGIQ